MNDNVKRTHVLVILAVAIFMIVGLIVIGFFWRSNADDLQITREQAATTQRDLGAANQKLQDGEQSVTPERANAERVPAIAEKVCRDSDGGLEYFTKGNIEFREFDKNGNTITSGDMADFCYINNIGDPNGNLREYYCDSRIQTQYEVFVCPRGCWDGACL